MMTNDDLDYFLTAKKLTKISDTMIGKLIERCSDDDDLATDFGRLKECLDNAVEVMNNITDNGHVVEQLESIKLNLNKAVSIMEYMIDNGIISLNGNKQLKLKFNKK